MSHRSPNGTRKMSGKYFVFRSSHQDKAYAKKIAAAVRQGDSACGCGCPKGTPHYARVVRYNWHDRTYNGSDFNTWAVYTFPQD